VALGEVAGRMKAEGQKVINLTMGEPDFDTPQFIVRAARGELRGAHTE
jgi:aspartate aminotransferase